MHSGETALNNFFLRNRIIELRRFMFEIFFSRLFHVFEYPDCIRI